VPPGFLDLLPAPPAPPSPPPSRSATKQFWKAGDYDGKPAGDGEPPPSGMCLFVFISTSRVKPLPLLISSFAVGCCCFPFLVILCIHSFVPKVDSCTNTSGIRAVCFFTNDESHTF
jgi:hypothetical protein